MSTLTLPETAPAPTNEPIRFVSVFANLLPDEIVGARYGRKVRRVIVAALIALVLLIIALTVMAKMQTSSAQSALSTTEGQGTTLLHQQSQYTPVVAAQAKSVAIEKQLNALMSGDVDWPKLLTSVSSAAPAGVTVTNLTGNVSTTSASAAGGANVLSTPSESIGTLSLAGVGPDGNAIATYLDALSKVPGIAVPYPAGVTAADGGGYSFTATLIITVAAKGGRYSQANGGH
jgi:Tfp pilus assembly protein PilV